MVTPEVRDVDCRQALNRVSGMPFRWSLNPYRGCTHGCHYCYARTTHAFLDLNADEDWTGVVLAKRNVAEVLRLELSAASWHRERVAVGTATDPYQPLEGQRRLTRACLQALREFRTPCWITTKGPLVVRDADLLDHAETAVSISIPTVDVALWRRLEPGTAHPRQRLRALARLADRGVVAGVLVAPLIPGLTDAPAQLLAVARAAEAHGARFLGGHSLYLTPGVREHFLGFLADGYPTLVPAYRRLYRSAYLPPDRHRVLSGALAAARESVGLPSTTAGGRAAQVSLLPVGSEGWRRSLVGPPATPTPEPPRASGWPAAVR